MQVSPRGLVSSCHVLLLALSTACSGGEDNGASSFGGSFTASQASQVTSASQAATEDTSPGTTGPGTTGEAVSVTEAPGTATTGEPATTEPATTEPATTEPATTEPATTEPATTEPATTDPSTTTGPDSTTTDADSSTTTGMTSMTTMEETTGDPPPPPPKDPQPSSGLYEHCLMPAACDPSTDACFTVNDANDVPTDGYCTILCNTVADCGPAPNAPAIQECFALNANQKLCGLKCKGVVDCPTGMACINLALPNNQTGMYCF